VAVLVADDVVVCGVDEVVVALDVEVVVVGELKVVELLVVVGLDVVVDV
jgi:hypothetical protein